MDFPTVNSPSPASGQDNRVATTIAAQIRKHDDTIREKIALGLEHTEAGNAIPPFLRHQLNTWKQRLTDPDDRALVLEVEEMLLKGHRDHFANLQSRAESKIASTQRDLAIRGLGRTMSGIQQLLSAA